jgi:hypothetical protein
MVRRHWLTLALLLSLAINLVIAGAAIARWQMGGQKPPLIWALEDLDEPTRLDLQPILKQSLGDTQRLRGDMRRASEQLRLALSQEPMSRADLELALASMRAATEAYQHRMHGSALEILPKLDREQRLALAGRLLRPGPPHRNHHGPNGRPPPPRDRGAEDESTPAR